MAVALTQSPETTRTPQRMVREWIRDEILGDGELDRDVVVRRAEQRFAHDSEFLDALVGYALPDMVTDGIRRICHTERGAGLVRVGGDYMTAEKLEETIVTRAARWYEHVGGAIRKPLLEMKKDDLLFAAGEREDRARGELRWAGLHRDLAEGMTKRQTVGDRYPASDLAAMYAKHFGEEN